MLISFSGIFIACSDDNDEDDKKPIVDPEPDPNPEDKLTKGYWNLSFYKGDAYEQETGYYWINLVSEDLKWNETKETYDGEGFILCVDFNSSLAETPDHPKPSEGVYNVVTEDVHDALTVNAFMDDSFVRYYYNDKDEEEIGVKSGTFEIKYEGEYMKIICDFVLLNDTKFEFTYLNKIVFFNRSTEGKHSNLEKSIEIKDLTQGAIIYNGPAYTESSDLYNIILAGDEYSIKNNEGDANSFNLLINVAPNSKDGIPSGIYTAFDALSADDYLPNTCWAGFYYPDFMAFMGCMFYNSKEALEAALTQGQVEVTNNGNNNYTFEVDMKDGYGNKVTGSYTGTVLYGNASEEQSFKSPNKRVINISKNILHK